MSNKWFRKRKLETHHFCDCGGRIYNLMVEKKKGGAGGIPMSIKSTGICECGAIHWKDDLTQFAKDEWDEYILDSSESMRRYNQWRVMMKNGEITKDEFNRLKRNAENGAGW